MMYVYFNFMHTLNFPGCAPLWDAALLNLDARVNFVAGLTLMFILTSTLG